MCAPVVVGTPVGVADVVVEGVTEDDDHKWFVGPLLSKKAMNSSYMDMDCRERINERAFLIGLKGENTTRSLFE